MVTTIMVKNHRPMTLEGRIKQSFIWSLTEQTAYVRCIYTVHSGTLLARVLKILNTNLDGNQVVLIPSWMKGGVEIKGER